MRYGVVYSCSRPEWLQETCQSAYSCKLAMPEVERELYLPKMAAELFEDSVGLFTRIVFLDSLRFRHRPRFDAMLQTQLDRAIFMDGDTLFVGPVPELFETLETVDITVAQDSQYLHSHGVDTGIYDKLPKVPLTVREWNCGVLGMRMTEGVKSFIEEWIRLFDKSLQFGYTMDQAAFRSAFFHSPLRSVTLPSNWNLRAAKPQFINGRVRILHAHGDLPAIAKTINRETGYRLYRPDPALIHGQRPKEYLKRRASQELQRKG